MSNLLKRKTRGDMIAVFQYLRGPKKEDRVLLFYPGGTINQLDSLSRIVVGAILLEVYKKRLDNCLCKILQGFMLGQGIGVEIHKNSLPTMLFYYCETSGVSITK
uniref:Uncharacterized protein n=1 Tax=Micrurus lemniscatus lemniscatus TaxID=129467 RepID=A0A2D4HK49_MICLE